MRVGVGAAVLLLSVLQAQCASAPPQARVVVQLTGLQTALSAFASTRESVQLWLYARRSMAATSDASLRIDTSWERDVDPLRDERRVIAWDGSDAMRFVIQLPATTFERLQLRATADVGCAAGPTRIVVAQEDRVEPGSVSPAFGTDTMVSIQARAVAFACP